ncbi:methylenetetrahydrofolate reductase [NAD(P)H] [Bombella sp. ESL0378]|uniref:methylenetetrahydrofolate reductase [NAD(P)H] n=1 Tax=Bombella sp. ESL0378 TaxID=2676442 RepID=UPI0012D8C110|nr:methylenetetrahydrofolate reductase [NAD(P)H] [Bombella sp. ESL0378]MUG05265.1 methylenetetrahydrofolate reductase [NAD(P)H] [Bombella sp. ESL0378]
MAEVSFEFFPAKTDEKAAALLRVAQRLAAYEPRFMSVTYGAGGSSRERTLEALRQMVEALPIPLAGHLTCVNAAKGEVDDVARVYWDLGVKHIVALRGDAPVAKGEAPTPYRPHPEGYHYAADLVAGLKKIAPFEISVAAYPETHPEAQSAQSDIEHLKEKFDAGADRAITQFFFDPECFLRFRDRAVKAGINKPIVPGILPIGKAAQAWRFAKMCGASVPEELKTLFEGVDDLPPIRTRLSAVVVDRLCQRLRAEGVEHFHFYTLNQSVPTSTLCTLLGRQRSHPLVELAS